MSAHRHRPQLEALEGRALLAAGHVPHSYLFTPIPEGTPLAEHIHPHLTIIINGQTQTIPAGIGIGPTGDLPIHTHTSDGTLHVESTQQLPFRLGDFFAIWGEPFNRRDILGYRANRRERITMTVDGRPSRQFGNVMLQDGLDIVIRYGRK
jgi:hypothetical protein